MSTEPHVRHSLAEKHTKLPWLYVVYHAPLRLVRPVPIFQLWRATSQNFSDTVPGRWIVTTTGAAAPIAQVGFRYLTERVTTCGFSNAIRRASMTRTQGLSSGLSKPQTLRPTIS